MFGLLVAGVHGALAERIAANAAAKLQREMQSLLVEAETFEAVEMADGVTGYWVGKGAGGEVVGYAIEVQGTGFADKIVLLVAVDGESEEVLGIAVLKSNETPGFGDKIKDTLFKNQFEGAPAGEKLVVVKSGDRSVPDEIIVAITGATISSEAVVKIVSEAVGEIKNKINKQ